jgi:hypothetical protein
MPFRCCKTDFFFDKLRNTSKCFHIDLLTDLKRQIISGNILCDTSRFKSSLFKAFSIIFAFSYGVGPAFRVVFLVHMCGLPSALQGLVYGQYITSYKNKGHIVGVNFYFYNRSNKCLKSPSVCVNFTLKSLDASNKHWIYHKIINNETGRRRYGEWQH